MKKTIELILNATDATKEAFTAAITSANNYAQRIRELKAAMDGLNKPMSESKGYLRSQATGFKRASNAAERYDSKLKKVIKTQSRTEKNKFDPLALANKFRIYFESIRYAIQLTKQFAETILIPAQASARLEALSLRMRILMRDTARADARMRELVDFAATTPFQLPDLVRATQILEVLSAGALNNDKTLRMLGDAASAAGTDLSNLTMWVARAYSSMQSGDKIGRAMLRLQQLGVISAQASKQLRRLSGDVDNADRMWSILREELSRFNGMTEKAAQTYEGLTTTLKDNIWLTLAESGTELRDVVKDLMRDMISILKQMREDGTVYEFAEAIGALAKAFRNMTKAAGEAYKYKDLIVAMGAFTPMGGSLATSYAGSRMAWDAVTYGGRDLKMEQRLGNKISKLREEYNLRKKNAQEAENALKSEKALNKYLADKVAKKMTEKRIQEVLDSGGRLTTAMSLFQQANMGEGENELKELVRKRQIAQTSLRSRSIMQELSSTLGQQKIMEMSDDPRLRTIFQDVRKQLETLNSQVKGISDNGIFGLIRDTTR